MLLAAPLLGLCFVAAYDAVLCLETRHRLGRAASVLARALAASGAPTEADPTLPFAQAARLAAPADLSRADVVVSLIASSAAGPARTIWRRRLAPLDVTGAPEPDDALAVTLTPGRLAVVAALAVAPDPWVVAGSLARGWFGDIWRVAAVAPVPAPMPPPVPSPAHSQSHWESVP